MLIGQHAAQLYHHIELDNQHAAQLYDHIEPCSVLCHSSCRGCQATKPENMGNHLCTVVSDTK